MFCRSKPVLDCRVTARLQHLGILAMAAQVSPNVEKNRLVLRHGMMLVVLAEKLWVMVGQLCLHNVGSSAIELGSLL